MFQLRKRSQKLDASIALDGEDHLNSLSDEVVLRVFKLLPRKILVKCSLVCREADFFSLRFIIPNAIFPFIYSQLHWKPDIK